MSLSVFDRNPEQWLQFRDSFQELIEMNDQLSDLQRMYFLRSSLKRRATEVIQALESSTANYEIAWTFFKRRFKNKTAIASRHLQLLLDSLTMQMKSRGQLRETLESMLRQIRALEQLEANSWDAEVIHISISQLDNMTRRMKISCKEPGETCNRYLDRVLQGCLILEPENVKQEFGKTQSVTRSEK